MNLKLPLDSILGLKLSLALVFLTGCAPLEPVDNTVPVIQSVGSTTNTVCGHDFTPDQLVSQPNFTEAEDSSIISGNTAEELIESLLSATPNRGVGSTVWNLKWRFDSRNSINGCQIHNVATEVDINYQLPLWTERFSASNAQVVGQWTEYSDALRAHHCMHGKTGIDASIEVKESLVRMAPRNSCEQLKVDADELARSIVGKYKDVESRFTAPVLNDYF